MVEHKLHKYVLKAPITIREIHLLAFYLINIAQQPCSLPDRLLASPWSISSGNSAFVTFESYAGLSSPQGNRPMSVTRVVIQVVLARQLSSQ